MLEPRLDNPWMRKQSEIGQGFAYFRMADDHGRGMQLLLMPEEDADDHSHTDFLGSGCITAFYEKVKNVKADVAAVLV
jgi:hypothetical protein